MKIWISLALFFLASQLLATWEDSGTSVDPTSIYPKGIGKVCYQSDGLLVPYASCFGCDIGGKKLILSSAHAFENSKKESLILSHLVFPIQIYEILEIRTLWGLLEKLYDSQLVKSILPFSDISVILLKEQPNIHFFNLSSSHPLCYGNKLARHYGYGQRQSRDPKNGYWVDTSESPNNLTYATNELEVFQCPNTCQQIAPYFFTFNLSRNERKKNPGEGPIMFGQSGGPLLDTGDQVIGVVKSLINPSEKEPWQVNFFVAINPWAETLKSLSRK